MKRFKDIQILLGVFTLAFWLGCLSLIERFSYKPAWVLAFSGLALVGTWLLIRAFLQLKGYFHAFKNREARLSLLASRDLATGLFQRNGFEWLLSKEIERAKRKDYSLALVLMSVDPLTKIQADIGPLATERLLYQIGENLQNACRAYDHVFKLDTNTFALFFTEAKEAQLEKILLRLEKRLEKSQFLVNTDRIKIAPLFKMGAALYPTDGTHPQSLEAVARARLIDPEIKTKNNSYAEPQLFVSEVVPSNISAAALEPLTTAVLPIESSDGVSYSETRLEDLKGTPEMLAFEQEIQSLFSRTEALKESVQTLLTEPVIKEEAPQKTSITTLESQKDERVLEETITPPPFVVTPTESFQADKIKPLNLEPAPPGLLYFTRKKPETLEPKSPALPKASISKIPESDFLKSAESVWSIEEATQMPDVVAALLQAETFGSAAPASSGSE